MPTIDHNEAIALEALAKRIDRAQAGAIPGTVNYVVHAERWRDAVTLARRVKKLLGVVDEFAKSGRDSRCETCAFRQGTPANTSLNIANALKCTVEGSPFWCHETERPCGGWVEFQRTKAD